MAIKPYSFRYPSDAQTFLRPWEKFFREGVGTDNAYWEVVRDMTERDRALEDYVSLGIGQGYLASAIDVTGQTGIPNSITDLTGLTVTVTVPPNRRLAISAHISLRADSAGPTGGILFLYEDAVIIAERASINTMTNANLEFDFLDITHFITPTVGTHTYKLAVISYVGGNARTTAASTRQNYITVEDIGPAN